MQVNAINSFKGRQSKIQRQQELDNQKDKALDGILVDMFSQFANGEADVLIISASADKDNNLKMDVRVIKDDRCRPSFNDIEADQFVIIEDDIPQKKVKKSLWGKIKEIFNK